MRQLNRLVSALVMLFALLLQADCVAQEFQNKFKPLPLIDRVQIPPGGPSLGITQDFRLRGLKSSEVTKYFLNIATQPGYLDLRGQLPLAKYRSRFFYGNKLSAAKSPQQPEIIVGSDSGLLDLDGFVLFDQQSNYYHVPDQRLTDAIFYDERKLIVTVGDTTKRGTWKVVWRKVGSGMRQAFRACNFGPQYQLPKALTASATAFVHDFPTAHLEGAIN